MEMKKNSNDYKYLDDYIPYAIVNGIVTKYKNKKNGRIISNVELELIKLKKLFGGRKNGM